MSGLFRTDRKAVAVRWFVACAALLLTAVGAPGQAILRGVDAPDEPIENQLVLPFAFYADSTDLAVGVGGATTGVLQPQLFLGVAGFGSTNGSYGFYFIDRDLQLKPFDRLFLDAKIGITRFGETDEYIDGNPAFDGGAGTNGSDEDNFVESETFSAFGEFPIKFVLPIGDGAATPIATYHLSHGVIKEGATGGHSWNPLVSGRTTLSLTPFAYWRRLDPTDGVELEEENFDTFGTRVGIRWDNSDFPINPTKGNLLRLELSRDFGIGSAFSQYTTLEGEYAQYIPLGQSQWFRQQVLALDIWSVATLAGETPYYAGASLGGYQRLRGYSFYRFHGDHAILGTAELRLMANYNPVAEWEAVDRLARVDWLQLVLFAEAGGVADNYSSDLFDDMKWDAGVGLRMMMRKTIVRADLAFGEEGSSFWLMVGQAF